MAGRFCNPTGFLTLFILEIAILLPFWMGDYWTPLFRNNKKTEGCDAINSSVVRKVIKRHWSPILYRYGVSLPMECPLNLSRDVFSTRESYKRTRSSHWQCLKCGKKFYSEKHLDVHMQHRHPDILNEAEDSICLAQFCDIMRCEVLKATLFLDEGYTSTEVSLWTPSSDGPSFLKKGLRGSQSSSSGSPFLGQKGPIEEGEGGSGSGVQGDGISNHVPHPPSPPSLHPQSSGCVEDEYFSALRRRCTDLVWECVQGLISVLEPKEFKALQNELELCSCSYLSCSKYGSMCWSTQSKRGPLRPFLVVFGSLLISLCIASAYYLAWIYTQTPEDLRGNSNVKSMNPCRYQHQSSVSSSSLSRTTHI